MKDSHRSLVRGGEVVAPSRSGRRRNETCRSLSQSNRSHTQIAGRRSPSPRGRSLPPHKSRKEKEPKILEDERKKWPNGKMGDHIFVRLSLESGQVAFFNTPRFGSGSSVWKNRNPIPNSYFLVPTFSNLNQTGKPNQIKFYVSVGFTGLPGRMTPLFVTQIPEFESPVTL